MKYHVNLKTKILRYLGKYGETKLAILQEVFNSTSIAARISEIRSDRTLPFNILTGKNGYYLTFRKIT